MTYWVGAALAAMIAAKAAPTGDLSRLKRDANLLIICESVATMTGGIFFASYLSYAQSWMISCKEYTCKLACCSLMFCENNYIDRYAPIFED